MNETVNKLLLAVDRFMPDLHLQQQQKNPHQNTQKQEKNNCKIYGDWKYRL